MTGEAPALAYQDLLQSAYDAFNERDLDYLLFLMHPDVDWPNAMEGGRIRGHQAVREYWTRQWDMIDPVVRPQRFELLPDGGIVAHVHQVVRDLDGKIILDQPVQHLYRLDGAQIVSMHIHDPQT
ncbi:MAG TPA: nuclear transport factor 2 family protein [Candidatus Acidoferrales bacterium]